MGDADHADIYAFLIHNDSISRKGVTLTNTLFIFVVYLCMLGS